MITEIYYSKLTGGKFMNIPSLRTRKKFTKIIIELSKTLGKKFDIPVSEYKNGKLNPDSVLIGSNDYHQLAGRISDLPLVVIDYHTDARHSSLDCCMYSNWVYHAIKKRPEVHLIVPDKSSFVSESAIPEGYEQDFHVYLFHGFTSKDAKVVVLVHDGESAKGIIEKEPKDLENLKRISGPKQISVDFDFFYYAGCEKEVEKIIEGMVTDGNIYDFWLHQDLYHTDSLQKKDPLERYISLFQKIHTP